MIIIQRPPGADTSVVNPNDVLYIKGNAVTDGSIRLIFASGATESNIEERSSGVWNDTGFRFSGDSISLGRDMVVSAVLAFLSTRNPSSALGYGQAVIPQTPFSNTGTLQLQSPVIKAEEQFAVYSGVVSEKIDTVIGIQFLLTPARIINKSIHEVGSVSSTEPVEIKFFTGTDNTGTLFSKKVLPANSMPSNSTLEIQYGGELGIGSNQNVFMEFSSSANISLKTDAGGNPLTIHDGQEISTVGIVTENLVYNNDLDHVFDNNINPVYANQF